MTTSACHSRMRRAILRRFSSVTISSPSWLSSTSVSMPRMRAACWASDRRRMARGPPAITEWPMSPLVTDTHLNLWPRAAHFAATPAVSSSQSSGCAPKVMMRSLPSAAAAGLAQAAVATNAVRAARAGLRRFFPARAWLLMPPPPLSRGVLRRTPEPPAVCAGVNPAPRAAFISWILPGRAVAILAPMSERPLLGIDAGGTKLLLLAQWSDHRDVDRVPTGSAFTGRHLDAEIDRFVSALGTAPVGAGVAVPGLIAADGSVQTCDVLPLLVGWRAEALGRLCPVRLLNDVAAASLEELHDLPAGSTAAVVMAGTGIGAAFVADGRPFRGACGWAGELGSIPIAGPEGVATLDQLASGAAILKRLGGGAGSVLTRAAAKDPAVLQALRVGGEALGLGLATVIDLLNPSVVAVGGGSLELPGYLEAAVESAARHSMPELWKVCEVRRVRQGELTAALGALRAIGAELV